MNYAITVQHTKFSVWFHMRSSAETLNNKEQVIMTVNAPSKAVAADRLKSLTETSILRDFVK